MSFNSGIVSAAEPDRADRLAASVRAVFAVVTAAMAGTATAAPSTAGAPAAADTSDATKASSTPPSWKAPLSTQ